MNNILQPDLAQQIEAAKAAAAQMTQLEALKAQADQLPVLQQRQADLQQADRAEQGANVAEAEARRVLKGATANMQSWRAEFDETLAKLQRLAEALPELQSGIDAAAHHAMNAAKGRTHAQQLRGGATPSGLPIEILALQDYGFPELWAALGGNGDALSPVPDGLEGQRNEALIRWLLQRENFVVYRPALSAKWYSRQ